VDAQDLRAAVRAALATGFSAALIEQPYRVAGRRAAAPAAQLDSAWIAAVEGLRETELSAGLLVLGGRSAGARVACRTAGELAARAVLCLAFPLHPPGNADNPAKTRLPELEAAGVPVLVVQGESDPFGRPPPGRSRSVVLVPGNHSLRDTAAVERIVAGWLAKRR
jgi:predicted alpha/beta-hydrolase family hydrolase